MRTILVGCMVVAVMLAGCAHAAAPEATNGQAPPASDQEPGETRITYSASGFSPQTITIEQGETVTWESEGPSMWVASSRHPTHREYGVDEGGIPTFDQRGTGQRYSFTFDKTGEWSYHNHVSSDHRGTVIVEPAN